MPIVTPPNSFANIAVPANWSYPTDCREQLVNGGNFGPIETVSVPVAMVTSLRGILLDVDPSLFKVASTDLALANRPEAFFEGVIAPMLARNPVLEKAEVRISGRGLHVILKFDEPVIFETEAERRKWAAIVTIVQRLLPTDPHCPGINAMTRPVGSVNGRNGRRVDMLRAGTPVTAREVTDLAASFQAHPFRLVAEILFGPGPISPCPVCNNAESRIGVRDYQGFCYGCGKIRRGHLFDAILAPRTRTGGQQ